MNRHQQTTQTTSDGTYKTNTEALIPKGTVAETLANIESKMHKFMRDVAAAQSAIAYNKSNYAAGADFIPRQEYVEAEEDVINQLLPHGLGGAKYFIYQNVRVYLPGEVHKVLAEEAKDVNSLLGWAH